MLVNIKKKILGSGTATLIISTDEMEVIIKMFKSPEDSGLLFKGISETIQNDQRIHHQRTKKTSS